MPHDPQLDSLYAELLQKKPKKPKMPGWKGKIGRGAKRMAPGMIGWLLLEKFLSGRHESKLQDIQTQGMRDMAALQTPENLILQASLPQAQEEEQMARTALLSQLSGGVIGPSLARGERRI